MGDENDEKLERVREYNPKEAERLDWRRVVRTHVGKITGEVVLHINEGEPLKVRTRRIVKTTE